MLGRKHMFALGLSIRGKRTSWDAVDFMLHKEVYHRDEREPKPESPENRNRQVTIDRSGITYREATLILTR